MGNPSFLAKILCIICLLNFSGIAVIAQEQSFVEKEDYTFVSNPYKSPLKPESQGDILPYTWAVRMSLGYAVSFMNFEYNAPDDADILRETSETGYDNFAMNVEVKFGISQPLERFSLGFGFDYNIFSLDEIKLRISDANNALSTVSKKDVAHFHVLSFLAFIEYRHPIQTGTTWICPYGRFGLGVNINNSSKDNTFSVQKTTLALMLAIGVEYHITPQISVFFEPRWHYNNTDFSFRPDSQTKYSGEMELSNLSFLIGVNFYFGIGKTL